MIEFFLDNIFVYNYGLNYNIQDFLHAFLVEVCNHVNIFVVTKTYTCNRVVSTIK